MGSLKYLQNVAKHQSKRARKHTSQRRLTWVSVRLPLADNSASILTRRSSYSSLQQTTYLVPVVISDGDFPMQSSTNTLTVRVCTCDREGNMKLCNAEALTGRAGLSTGALVAILLCVIILLSEYMQKLLIYRPTNQPC